MPFAWEMSAPDLSLLSSWHFLIFCSHHKNVATLNFIRYPGAHVKLQMSLIYLLVKKNHLPTESLFVEEWDVKLG